MHSSKRIIAATAIFALVGVLLVGVGQVLDTSQAQGENMRESGFGVYLTTDRIAYTAGQPIEMELRVLNRTGEKLTLQFRNGQRFDFALNDSDGNEAWRWSRGRMFTMALGTETVGPARRELAYRETFAATLAPGTYKLTGTVTARNMPMAASLTIEVR